MYYRGNKTYYARSGLNPNKRDKPQEQPREEPELLRKIRKCESDAAEPKKN